MLKHAYNVRLDGNAVDRKTTTLISRSIFIIINPFHTWYLDSVPPSPSLRRGPAIIQIKTK
ncbi:hypothetical protein M406DRAFT_54731 [Cryphonectria parasitica EP155]|uniref:Uncharacterized protein n=1 Tax=Cryphonectria parasitica (strain ATCC 38755 / EP155) TaxID=660469 RepID=A0A9P5CQH3_CRYP1|nr:uncharacterized protein M406DRAFT_54731 [Cryphonectria parasitica EP155]KAF3766055.1 hypothetical protein M406DRAFT_54731 [Cryphonectria parasitica EP155]